MSGSDGAAWFVDYEIYSAGVAVLWGQLALTPPPPARSAADLLDYVREVAGRRHGAPASDVRVRCLARL